VGEQTLTARPGDTVFGPRGVPHTFMNRGPSPAHMLLLVTPAANFERFYASLMAPMPAGGPVTLDEMIARTRREAPGAGIDILGPNPL
jgi:uncharacterized RmlC-like cupin family protein